MEQRNDIESAYNTYVDDLYSYAVYLGFDRKIVMDAIHDVFLKLYTHSEVLGEVQNLKHYLLRSLKNNLINAYKARKETVTLHTIEDSKEALCDIEDNLICEEDSRLIKEKIDKMLASLTKKQREIMYLRYVQEYDYEQIAELLNITSPACRKLVHKAMQSLRKNDPLLVLLVLSI